MASFEQGKQECSGGRREECVLYCELDDRIALRNKFLAYVNMQARRKASRFLPMTDQIIHTLGAACRDVSREIMQHMFRRQL